MKEVAEGGQEQVEAVKEEAGMEAVVLDGIEEIQLETGEVELLGRRMMVVVEECTRMKHNNLMENSSCIVLQLVGDIHH